MKSITKRMIALAGVLAIGLVAARAQSDGALLDALVKKGVLSDQEAEDIRADETKDYSKTSASKLAIGDYVKKLQFYGDGRLRFDNANQKFNYQNGVGVNDRERYRLRFGLLYTYSDQISAGFELRSGTADDTANQSFGGSYTDATINVSKIFLQYKPISDLTLIAGKFTNPLYTTTDMVWADDLTPEGGAETYSHTFTLGGGSEPAPVSRDPKDAKSIAPAPAQSSPMLLTVGWTGAQYIYINNNENNGNVLGSGAGQDVFTIANQIPITLKVNDDLTFKVVPGFTFYTGGGNTSYAGDVPFNQNGAGTGPTAATFALGTANSSVDPVFYSPIAFNNLNVISAPGEIDYNLFSQKLRTYWDFNYNVTAQQRVQNVYLGPGGAFAPGGGAAAYGNFPAAPLGAAAAAPSAATQAAIRKQNQNLSDGVAWAVGEQIGENKKKGDWSVLGEFRQVGLGALDPNTNGTDYANSYANQQGVKIKGVYNFTDYLTLGVTYYNTWNYKDGLYSALGGPNGVNGNKPAAGSTQYLVGQASSQRVQIDLGWKF